MLEEYFLPSLIIVFIAGFLIGLNLGMICSRSVDQGSIPAYALRRENLPVRYPGSQPSSYQQQTPWGSNLVPEHPKRRMNLSGINGMTFK